MKKNGFTLSELIVTLSIIGVVSALMMPALTKAMPDRNKTKVITIHSKISGAVNTLIGDNSIYWCLDYPAGTPARNRLAGLSCEFQPQRPPYNNSNFEGNNKFENLLRDQLGLENSAWGRFRYSTPDGVFWDVVRGCSDANTNIFIQNAVCNQANDQYLSYRIIVDVNGAARPNVSYVPNMRLSLMPDRFAFRVDNYGNVTPDDAMTASYLKNATRTSSKKDDKSDAANLYNRYARYRAEL